ncbi:MAG: hypothetical protein M8861_09430 [marine benthic group bacterium]|nr:hypothetical protein [Gemmatimonadota bacterium]
MSKRIWLFTAIVLASACGPSMKTQVRVELDPLPADHEVKVFASDLPTCEYQEVGLIASEDLDATLTKAREMGADGVIGTVLAEADRPAGERSTCGTPNCVQYNTVAIRFTDPACTD